MKLDIYDRVKVYGGLHNFPTCPELDGVKATVLPLGVDADNFPASIRVELDLPVEGTTTVYVHPKQCRKLKTKRRLRRLYALIPDYGCSGVTAYFDKSVAEKLRGDLSLVEFKEVK